MPQKLPSKELSDQWIFHIIDNDFDDSEKIGKWILIVEKGPQQDEIWTKLHSLNINGIVSLKSSTQATKNLGNSHGEISVFCGPYDDKNLMAEIGQEIISHTNYSHPTGEMVFGKDVSRQKVDILYKLKVPKKP